MANDGEKVDMGEVGANAAGSRANIKSGANVGSGVDVAECNSEVVLVALNWLGNQNV
jgi:hypothetical protein